MLVVDFKSVGKIIGSQHVINENPLYFPSRSNWLDWWNCNLYLGKRTELFRPPILHLWRLCSNQIEYSFDVQLLNRTPTTKTSNEWFKNMQIHSVIQGTLLRSIYVGIWMSANREWKKQREIQIDVTKLFLKYLFCSLCFIVGGMKSRKWTWTMFPI